MSVVLDNVILYGCQNFPVTGDGTTIGGAVNMADRVGFSDISSNGTMSWTSSSASDTAVTGVGYGRDPTGIIVSSTTTLNGQTPVTGTVTFQRLLQGYVSGTLVGDIAWITTSGLANGTAQAAANSSGVVGPYITLQAGQVSGTPVGINTIIRILNNTPAGVQFQLRRVVGLSGSTDIVFVNEDWGTVPSSSTTYELHNGMLFERSPNSVTGIARIFYNCAAQAPGGTTTTYYAKVFVNNTNSSTALTNVGYEIVSTTPTLPAGATIEFGLASGLNDNLTAANRQTAPAGITFTTGGLPVSSGQAASGGALPAGNTVSGALGMWYSLALLSGTAPFDGFASIQVSGTTT